VALKSKTLQRLGFVDDFVLMTPELLVVSATVSRFRLAILKKFEFQAGNRKRSMTFIKGQTSPPFIDISLEHHHG
jgi:hypothetical protein